VTLRFHAGGGRPPRSHEELLVEPDGRATYRTGMPWPAQPPFEEAGVYADVIGPPAAARLHQLARAALADPPPAPEDPDTGAESVRIDGPRVRWDPDHRPPVATAAREVIAHVRTHPLAALRAARAAGDRLELTNPGREPVTLGGGEAWGGDGSPLALVTGEAAALELPGALAPGEAVVVSRAGRAAGARARHARRRRRGGARRLALRQVRRAPQTATACVRSASLSDVLRSVDAERRPMISAAGSP
jgi:hypothetical protein